MDISAYKLKPGPKTFPPMRDPQKTNTLRHYSRLLTGLTAAWAFLLIFVFSAGFAAAAEVASTMGKVALAGDTDGPVKPAGETETVLTYEEAVALALQNSIELKNAREGTLQAEEIREQLADMRRASGSTPVGPGYDAVDAANRELLSNFTTADTSWRMSAKQIEILEGTIEYQVRSAYDEVLQSVAGLDEADRALALSASKLAQTETRTRLGLESSLNRENARSSHTAAKEQRAGLARQLDAAYVSLNKLLGLKAGGRPRLQEHDLPVWLAEEPGATTEPDEAGLEHHLALILNDHPYLWLQEQKTAQAERELSLYTYNVGAPPYKVVESTVQQEKNNLYALKDEVQQGVRSLYYQLRGLESQYKALAANSVQAETGLHAIRLRYNLGMATLLEVEQAEQTVLEIKNGMQDLARAYGRLKMLYERPWLLPASLN